MRSSEICVIMMCIILASPCPAVCSQLLNQTCLHGYGCVVLQTQQPELSLADWQGSGLEPDDTGPDIESLLEPTSFQLSATPSFVASVWGACSVTCGTGLRHRQVLCKVLDEASDTVMTLHDIECSEAKPRGTEVCQVTECSDHQPLEHSNSYIWRFKGYSPCSASCLGGIQTSTFSCVRILDFSVALDVMCRGVNLPSNRTRTCNDVPCPPRWRVTRVGPCSVSCGPGTRAQLVECVQQYGRGEGLVRTLATQACPQGGRPPNAAPCTAQYCPAWISGPWSQCSRSCGRSVRRREISCVLNSTPGLVLPVSQCSGPRPSALELCRRRPCSRDRAPEIVADRSWFVQLRPLPRVSLDVGGRATLLQRTTVKVKCRVRHFNKKLIVWMSGGSKVSTRGHIKHSVRTGALRIRNIRRSDSGTYTCVAGNVTESITIDFHTTEDTLVKMRERSLLIRRFNASFAGLDIDQKKMSLISIRKSVRHVSMLPFHYVTGTWSACSKSCGAAGLQYRPVTCELVLPSYLFVVRDKLCVNRGQEKPAHAQDCGHDSCPSWRTGPWSECSDQHCSRRGVGTMRRRLACVHENDLAVSPAQCDQENRPQETTECRNNRCQPAWYTSPWSKCSRTCGGEGRKTRTLHCVWRRTGRAAGANCLPTDPRPPVSRPCSFSTPCYTESQCKDHSKYCSLVTQLKFCRFTQYHRDCCQSCTHHESTGSASYATENVSNRT